MADTDRVARAVLDDGAPVEELIARYLTGAAVLREAIAGMTPDQLHARPIAGKMSSQEVVCHIVDADQFLADRMKRTVATERPLLMGVESVDYLEPLHYAERDLDLDIRLLAVTREQMAADLARIADDAWLRVGVHSEIGLVTVRQLLLHAIRHLESHALTIEAKRDALGIPR